MDSEIVVVSELRYSSIWVGSASFNDKLKSFLSSVKNYDGASGKITLDDDGATRSLEVRTYEVSQGTRQLIQPPEIGLR